MTPGEYFIKDGEIEFNQGLEKTVITVKNVGDRPIQVGSHYHFYEVNPSLVFDKENNQVWFYNSQFVRYIGRGKIKIPWSRP